MGAGIPFPPLQSQSNNGWPLYRCPLRTTSDTIPFPRSLPLSQSQAKKSRSILIFQQRSNSKPWTTSWMPWTSWKQGTQMKTGKSIKYDFYFSGAQIGSIDLLSLGSTRVSHIIRPFTARSKPSSTVRWYQTSRPTLFRHRIPSLRNTLTLQSVCSGLQNMPWKSARLPSTSRKACIT